MFNVAIVGCGYWGPNLIRNFNSLENCTVRAICDMSESRLAHMKTLYPATETTTDFEALINDPDIIIADEPTGNLDSRNGQIVVDLLAELNRKWKRTVIIATHSSLADSLATIKISLKDGMISDG